MAEISEIMRGSMAASVFVLSMILIATSCVLSDKERAAYTFAKLPRPNNRPTSYLLRSVVGIEEVLCSGGGGRVCGGGSMSLGLTGGGGGVEKEGGGGQQSTQETVWDRLLMVCRGLVL